MENEVAGNGSKLSVLPLKIAIVVFAAITPAILMAAPAIAAQLGRELHLGPVEIGNLFSAELGAMSIATLPAYWWLPRFNWRLMALTAALVFIGGNVASALAESYTTLVVCRIVAGLAGGSLMVLCLTAAARLPNQGRTYGLWVLGQLVIGALGLWFLPVLFESLGLSVIYYILSGYMVLSLPLINAFPKRPLRAVQPSRVQPLPFPESLFGIIAVLAFYIGLSAIWTFIGDIAQMAGLVANKAGEVLSLATLLGIAGAACASLIGNRGSRSVLLILGYFLMIISIGLLYGGPNLIRFVVATFLFKFTWTFALPWILATIAELDSSGRLINTTNLVIGAGLALGPAMAGWIIEASGAYTVLILISMLIIAFSMTLILIVQKRLVARQTSLANCRHGGE